MRVASQAGLPQEPWKGRAVLCFHRTTWFGDESPSLLGLVAPGLSPSPRGMALADLPRVRPGARLEFDGDRWVLEGVGELETRDSLPVSGRLEARGPNLPPETWTSAWTEWFYQNLSGSEAWLLGLVQGPGPDWRRWMGLGPGSTPAGDDYLAGWWAALWSRGLVGTRETPGFRRASEATSALSRHYLWHLADGWADQAFVDFLSAQDLPLPDSDQARAWVHRGDTSGRATLVGLFAGLTTPSVLVFGG